MARIAMTMTLSLCLGVVAGVSWAHYRLNPQLEDARADRSDLRQANNQLRQAKETFQKEAGLQQRKLARLSAENEAVQRRVTNLLEEVASLSATVHVADEEIVDAVTMVDEEGEESSANAGEGDARRRMFQGRFGGRGAPSEEQIARWREAEADRRDRMAQMYDDRLWRETDPAARERIQALAEYQTYFDQLRNEMRAAQSDEDRAAIMTDLREAGQAFREIQTEQRDFEFRRVASQYGITDPQQQDKLLQELRSAMQDPILSSGGGFFGGRPQGRGRGNPARGNNR